MRMLVLGSKGQLGCCLADQLSYTDYDVIYTSRSEIDMADLAGTKASIIDLRPNIVINASAYTAVDKAEDDQYEAEKINHLAVANIANTCSEIGCWLIHISTDYVFDGAASHPYGENAETNPQGVYGDSKLKGELAIQVSGCQYLIIRTAWVYSEYGNNFLKTMLRLGSDRDELSIVGDQIGCPTYAQDIAKSIVSMVSKLNLNSSISGIFHYCGDQACSWHEFAQAIFLEAKTCGWKTPNHINAIDAAKYPTRAVRPPYSVLSCSKIYDTFEITPSNWRKGIKYVLAKLNNEMFDR
tara:strand:- start:1011 stop:1901 length:891 start_codon:yes stop_codon:yes gene_type:complete